MIVQVSNMSLKIIPFEEELGRPKTAEKVKKTPFHSSVSKFLSIRSVLICISIATIISMAAGLITLSIQGQHAIVDNLGDQIQSELNKVILLHINGLFSWAHNQSLLSSYFFYDYNIPPMGSDLMTEWRSCREHLWSVARGLSVGVEVEVDLDDGRFFGFDNFKDKTDAYLSDFVNDTLIGYFWHADLDKPILDVNLSLENQIPGSVFVLPGPYPIYDFLRGPNRPHLNTCGEIYWVDLYFYGSPSAYWVVVSVYQAMCNRNGTIVAYMAVSFGLSSIVSVLSDLTDQYDGKIFIMDQNFNLIASSTNTPIFDFESLGGMAGDGATRENVKSTKEVWIQDVFAALDGRYSDHTRVVSLNGTKYLLSVTLWSEYGNIEWTIVKLLDYDQFMKESDKSIEKSIIAAVVVAVIVVLVVLVVTYFTTKPLAIIAHDLQRMAMLDLDYKPIDTPRLNEVRKLYKSVIGMNVALRSFKKFVPLQVISKIIKSEMEVTPELKFTNLTCMFQDIEGFTSLSETLDPMDLAKLTAEYMSLMTDIIVKHGGTIDKYIGDCIMSLFNAPDELKLHECAAVNAAVECHLMLLQKNKEWRQQYNAQMFCRSGINSGQVLVGNMGSDNRMNYTAFGDNINIAARLEGANKYFGSKIIISKSIFSKLPKGKFVARKLGKVKVSGKQVATAIYEVRADFGPSVPQQFQLFEAALKAFKHQDFASAMEHVNQALVVAPTDLAAQQLRKRIQETMQSPLDTDWSYVEELVKF